ncbi:C6 zinc finger domain protein [Penicillium atrosanguineum]|uniref:C6 zinc finger domain protein n=1 Tax=Penicillium atrosanguineum TaxID=1132637 RepID=A0A9W9GJS4_9EURO|nr:uncharacterized protein N7443_006254 [Penicillium atrosanguineum]KAJ5122911.1 C6 zinc finger domain protein [Penicillium atrosanguineum]KAJ5137211.1 C6 zinc finger domain protein [Penicillium atrosanguineum]KAJ5298134.1 hypothetical protein N7443_006254 [Penicillium atrosanguineum]KAJ5321597.1 C6 zinc finger domain protein [Penicillium atrosanguineum]
MPVGLLSRLKGRSTGYVKSRQGCKTCKIRKVKCGEEKPHCTRCATTGHKCEYEGTISIIDNPVSSAPNTVWQERRSFAYYFQQAAPSVGGVLDVTFWRTIVPQVCRSEPAVWDAIITIGALFESPEPCPNLTSIRRGHSQTLNQNHQNALGWYSRSVSAIRQQIERGRLSMFVGLISCLLFICIESLQGGVEEASQLYTQGVRLIIAFRAQIAAEIVPPANTSFLEDVIVPIFLRLGSIALPLAALQVDSLLEEIEDTSTQGFNSLRSAREGIVLIAAETQVFERECVEYLRETDNFTKLHDLTGQKSALSARLEIWHSAFVILVDSLRRTEVSPQQIGMGALLFASYEALFITLRLCLSSAQTDTDAYTQNFQNIVEQSEIALHATARPDGTQPPCTFELSVGLPLWFTCLRCREPRTRRTALALLRRAPRVLGIYQTRSVLTFGEQIMALEERYGMAMNAGQARASSALLKSTNPPGDHLPDSQCKDSEDSKIDLSTLVAAPDDETIASIYSMPAGFENSISTSILIPEEARMGPIRIFRPQDGLPQGTTEDDIARWKPSRDQLFLRFTWNERDPTTDTWRRAHEYIPTTL